MIHFAWKRIKNRKLTSILLVFAFLSLLILTPLGIQQSKEAKLLVKGTIEKHGRGTYDILVRPAGVRTDIEKKMGIVEENYIGDSKGGISLKEWEEIKKMPDIDVAAPVASLGYFSGKSVQVELPHLEKDMKYTTQFYTSDGVNEYKIGEPENFFYFKEKGNQNSIQYIKYPIKDEQFLGDVISSSMPPNYNLLVGIDPTSEKKLTNIDYSKLNEIVDTPDIQHITTNYPGTPILKILQREDINISLYMKLTAEKINLNIKEAYKSLGISDGSWLLSTEDLNKLTNYQKQLIHIPTYDSKSYTFNLSPFQKPFEGTALIIDKNFKISNETTLKVFSMADTMVYFVANKIEYIRKDNQFNVPIVDKVHIPSYKNLTAKGGIKDSSLGRFLPYYIKQVGSFKAPINKETLTSSPLGIYNTTPVVNEKNKVITPTTNPGSFIPAPASGLTDLEGATLIKGDKPIDAIRIRVAGEKSYTSESISKINNVAEQLLKKGYEVDIVAGASFHKVPVNVEGIGLVTESWTTLGAAQKLTDGWNIFMILSSALFLLFSVIFVGARLQFEKNVTLQENQLLYNLGWTRGKIFLRNVNEQYVLLGTAFILSLIGLVAFQANFSSYIITLGLFGFIAIMIAITLWRTKVTKQRTYAYKRMATFIHFKKFIYPAFLILMIASVLMMVQVAYLGSMMELAKETTMGQYIGDLTLFIHIGILVATIILSLVGVTELILALLLERKNEINMYYTIGWTRKMVTIKLTKEMMLWITIAILVGLFIGTLTLFFMNVTFVWIGIGAGSVFILMEVILLCIVINRLKRK